MDYIGIDTETRRFGKGEWPPAIVCLQYAVFMDEDIYSCIVEKAQPAFRQEIIDLLSDEKAHFVLQNAAFDFSVLVKNIPETAPLIWKALDEGRVHDTMIREMLYNLTATGDIDNVEHHGVKRRAAYSLAAMTKQYTGVDRSEMKEGEDAARVHYAMVEDKLQEDWPDEFVEYAKNDPADTLKVFFSQEAKRKELIDRIGYDPFETEAFRVRAHFALQLMTSHGNLLDTERVDQVAEEFDELYNDPKLVKPLTLSRFIEELAKTNDERITDTLIEEAMEIFDSLDESEQKQWLGKGTVIPAIPPTPYKNGAKDHTPDCIYNKENPDYCGKNGKDCDCPVKMKGGQKEKGSQKTLHSYIWDAGLRTDAMEVWASDSLVKLLKEEGIFKEIITGGKVIDQEYVVDLLKREKAHLQDSEDEADRIKADTIDPLALPKGWRISTDKEWMASYALLDPLLERHSTRKKYEKIITSYLPGLYWAEGMLNCPDMLEGETSRLAGKKPSDIVYSTFQPLKRTGRTSSKASTNGKLGKSKIYNIPSMNGQQVDPRIRPCIVPREGYVLFSVDYSGMELGTLAQKCRNLFGFSVLGDVINSGGDAHAYLAMHIAQELDHGFAQLVQDLDTDEMYSFFQSKEDDKAACGLDMFKAVWEKMRQEGSVMWERLGHEGDPLWKDFHKYYRTFAKPTGLGYPGGLGPKTFVSYAKGQYGVAVDLGTAEKLRAIWKKALPEMAMYLDHISKRCFDPNHRPETKEDDEGKKYKKKYYFYDTALGMHRAKTDFCACANGKALQSDSAEGALLAVSEIQREIYSGCESILSDVDGVAMVRPTIFVHDELFGEIRDDDKLTERIEHMQQIMKDCMEVITPDIVASTEACTMLRWSKAAFPYYVDGKLRPYEEKLELDKEKEEES